MLHSKHCPVKHKLKRCIISLIITYIVMVCIYYIYNTIYGPFVIMLYASKNCEETLWFSSNLKAGISLRHVDFLWVMHQMYLAMMAISVFLIETWTHQKSDDFWGFHLCPIVFFKLINMTYTSQNLSGLIHFTCFFFPFIDTGFIDSLKKMISQVLKVIG